jgi:cell division protease FtsH
LASLLSTGAQNDMSRATDMAKSMVKEYGMSGKAGQVYFAHERRSEFLGYGMSESPDYSEATSEMIDSEISQIISTQHQRALEILNKQKEILIKGASLLLKNEKIQGDELKALVQETNAGFQEDVP